MHPVGLEPTISAGERPQKYAFNRATTETDSHTSDDRKYYSTVPFKNFITLALVF